jgi:2-hydroxy-3-keto-5-methylthiopentenyl-1-phosphate phosphatase
MEQANGNKSEFVSSPQHLEEMFPGVQFDMLKNLVGHNVNELNSKEVVPLFENKIDLIGRTDEFVRWIKERDERVIVGKC